MRFTTRIAYATVALAATIAITFSACRKNKDTDASEDTGYASDHATLEKTYADAQSIVDQAATSGSLSTFKIQGGGSQVPLAQCATITNDTTVNPHLLTVDFGTSNCLCNDGSYRRGKILVSYTGRYRDMGHSHTITFSNYFVNDNGVSGSKTVTYSSNSASGNPVYNISVNGQIALANGNGTISWTATKTRTWLQGYNTPTWTDDEYEVSGSGTITRANGKQFNVNITTPLHVALNCRWIESGVVNIQEASTGSTLARVLDYGTGTCDNQATVTVNGKVYTITLR